jgi:hypothetical protein
MKLHPNRNIIKKPIFGADSEFSSEAIAFFRLLSSSFIAAPVEK